MVRSRTIGEQAHSCSGTGMRGPSPRLADLRKPNQVGTAPEGASQTACEHIARRARPLASDGYRALAARGYPVGARVRWNDGRGRYRVSVSATEPLAREDRRQFATD